MKLQYKNKLPAFVAGFSLIELMIVIAIIGVLASIAVPSYESYVSRAKFSHLVSVGDDIRKKVSEFHSTNGTFPTAAQVATFITLPQDLYIFNATGAGTSTIGNNAIGATTGLVVNTAGTKYSLFGTATGFPNGDPILQLVAVFTPATATSAPSLSWTCNVGMTSANTVAGTAPAVGAVAAPASFIPATCNSAVVTVP